MSTDTKRIGKYELQEWLGRGSLGEVWQALDTQLHRDVVIKLIRTELQSDSHFVKHFGREMLTLAALHHPNITNILDFQTFPSPETDNPMYIAMDFVEGQTLDKYLRSTARIGTFPSAADLVHLFVPISMALDYVHRQGIIHGNIKPTNILLDKRFSYATFSPRARNPIGEPLLTDFGLAQLVRSATNTQRSWRTPRPYYCSPEQARGLPCSKQCDLYSLGIILYELCTGLLPFNGNNTSAILKQHLNATPTPPSLINANIPPALTLVILQSIAKDPEERFSSATAMTMALCEALDMPIPENLRQAALSSEEVDAPSELSPRKLLQPIKTRSESVDEPPKLSTRKLPQPARAISVEASQPPKMLPPDDRQAISPVVNPSGPSPTATSDKKTRDLSSSSLPTQSGRHFFMQPGTIEGEDLEHRMERLKQPMEERDVLLYASQILDILDVVGRQIPPIVHGEIQPATIFIGTRDKQAHLIKDSTRNTDERLTLSPQLLDYIPPEQLWNSADPRSDLYALAATMYYLLTNRNPRNYPRFVYPPVRTLNPQISPEVEKVLTCALTNDLTQRYQRAAEMKRDIDAILLSSYEISGNDTEQRSESTGVADARGDINRPTLTRQPANTHQQSSLRPQTGSLSSTGGQPSPHQPLSRSGRPLQPVWQQLSSKKWKGIRLYNLLLIVLVLLVVTGELFSLFYHNAQSNNQATSTIVPPDDIAVIKAPDGENIGMSDGTFAFDTSRPDGNLKTQAAQYLKTKDFGSADSLWQQALSKDSNDAEALIYMEDQRILDAGNPSLTIVVATTLTGDANSIAIGRENLQAAYVAQKEYNTTSRLPSGVKVRLLIANSGAIATYATPIAQQIVQVAQKDKTIVGVMGWTLTAATLNAIGVLSAAKIPMVTNSGADVLTGRSPYFFRVALPASTQGDIGAKYAEQSLSTRTAVVFVDAKNNFALGLANGFTSRFTADGHTIVATENYTVGNPGALPPLLKDALSKHPDLIYFAGYPGDLGAILSKLQPSDPIVLGGSSLYQLGGYSTEAHKGLGHLRFTAYSYPDEWDILGMTNQKPAFFTDYQADYDPKGQYLATPYGYDRPDGTTMEMYDAISVLLYGSSTALAQKSSITGSDLQSALAQIAGNRAFQGVTSQISFGSDSNPTDRAIVIICVDQGQFLKMDGIYGKFLVGETARTQIFTPSACS